jgi:hypothetical protein
MPDRPLPEDASVEGHRARIQAAVEQYIQSLKDYTDELFKKYRPQARPWLGTCTGLNTAGKTATVNLDPFPQGVAQPGTRAAWGRKSWSPAQIVGKRVRVFIDDETKTMWIDDVLE